MPQNSQLRVTDDLLLAISTQLRAQQALLCTAESCTGGGIAARLTDLPGSSTWFECGWVTYSNRAKTELLGVAPDLLHKYGAVSAETAAAMVVGALEHCNADCALSVTGIAGPGGGTPEKPVGLVWFGWLHRGGQPRTEQRQFTGDRQAIRDQASAWALEQLLLNELARDIE